MKRRMAALDTAEIVLPFDIFGNHLDSNKTIDDELEVAGEVLSTVWSESVIDGHRVVAKFRLPGDTNQFEKIDQKWMDTHIKQSRYLLQITRCNNSSCCSEKKISYKEILGSLFTSPNPIEVYAVRTRDNLKMVNMEHCSKIFDSASPQKRRYSMHSVRNLTV